MFLSQVQLSGATPNEHNYCDVMMVQMFRMNGEKFSEVNFTAAVENCGDGYRLYI